MGGRKRRRKGHTANAGKAGAGAPASFLDGTAYRRAEKAYRRYTHDGAPETDFGDVIDCRDLDNNTEQNRRRLQRVPVSTENGSDAVLYTLDGCPGLYLAPSVLSEHEQCELVHSAANAYQRPPNATNLTAVQQHEPTSKPEPEPESEPEPGLQALTLDRLSRLRWATLGYQYQWTSRTYEAGKVTEMPSRLSELCSSVARAAGHEMEPQAAIVNYYNPKVIRTAALRYPAATHGVLCAALTLSGHADRQSTMGGHVDDAELDLSLPLVSLSLGLTAVFLFGGPTREDAPTALWLRSGDAVIVTGEARLCYHGVPRILEGSCPDFLLDPRRYSKLVTSLDADAGDTARGAGTAVSSGVAKTKAGPLANDESEAFNTALVEYMASARININVRQLARVETPEHLAQLIAQRSLHDDAEQSAMSSVLGNRSVRQTSASVASGRAGPVLDEATATSPVDSSTG
jgi:alkylated DNA repair protein alkB family protein 1